MAEPKPTLAQIVTTAVQSRWQAYWPETWWGYTATATSDVTVTSGPSTSVEVQH